MHSAHFILVIPAEPVPARGKRGAEIQGLSREGTSPPNASVGGKIFNQQIAIDLLKNSE